MVKDRDSLQVGQLGPEEKTKKVKFGVNGKNQFH
jgi:hypothetical protein